MSQETFKRQIATCPKCGDPINEAVDSQGQVLFDLRNEPLIIRLCACRYGPPLTFFHAQLTCAHFTEAFLKLYTEHPIMPDAVVINPDDEAALATLILQTPSSRLNLDGVLVDTPPGDMRVTHILNVVTGVEMPVQLDPAVPRGEVRLRTSQPVQDVAILSVLVAPESSESDEATRLQHDLFEDELL